MRNNREQCPYCGQFMAYEDDAEWGERWVCSNQSAHILADPERWSVLAYPLGEDAVDIYGQPISGLVGAHRLTREQLRTALGVEEQRGARAVTERPRHRRVRTRPSSAATSTQGTSGRTLGSGCTILAHRDGVRAVIMP